MAKKKKNLAEWKKKQGFYLFIWSLYEFIYIRGWSIYYTQSAVEQFVSVEKENSCILVWHSLDKIDKEKKNTQNLPNIQISIRKYLFLKRDQMICEYIKLIKY